MSWAIFSLTAGGMKLGKELSRAIPDSQHFTMPERADDLTGVITPSLKAHVSSVFNQYDIIIFIMATGIVVRTIEGLLQGKDVDPGVLVIDDKGRFVISLLSGHLGGANSAAEKVAKIINATPVITTASDSNGMLSPDMLAVRYDAVIDDMTACRELTSIMVNGGAVALYTEAAIPLPVPYVSPDHSADGFVYLTNRIVKERKFPSLHLVPRNIVIGTGCKRGTSPEELKVFISEELNALNIDARAVCSITSIDIKKDEPAILEAARSLHADTIFISAEQILTVESQCDCSTFVRATTGVGSVAEACAFLVAGKSEKMILSKKIKNGMTLAIAEKPLTENK